MFKSLSFVLISLALAFQVGCSSKSKNADADTSSPSVSGSDGGIEVDPLGSDSGNISGLSSVQFDYDQFSLSSAARRQLAENANWIKEKTDYTIQIEGHCDSRGSVEYNLALGEKRAKAAKRYLVSLGIPSKRLTIISYGKEKLLAYGDSESDHSNNRRANFVPLPK